MRLEFFGDSYDIVKRALIQWLAPLGQWHVQPLFTDDVSQQQATTFARFLGARLIEPFQARTPAEYKAALDGCKGVGNLLVDPDVGVSLPRPGKPVKRTHLSAANLHEIAVLIPVRSSCPMIKRCIERPPRSLSAQRLPGSPTGRLQRSRSGRTPASSSVPIVLIG